jgi:hypothetical protein
MLCGTYARNDAGVKARIPCIVCRPHASESEAEIRLS